MVLTAADIAAWANRFPGICVKIFRPHLRFDSLEVWGAQATSIVGDFAPIPKWEQTMKHLTTFCDPRNGGFL
jgi:hypothetical protein